MQETLQNQVVSENKTRSQNPTSLFLLSVTVFLLAILLTLGNALFFFTKKQGIVKNELSEVADTAGSEYAFFSIDKEERISTDPERVVQYFYTFLANGNSEAYLNPYVDAFFAWQDEDGLTLVANEYDQGRKVIKYNVHGLGLYFKSPSPELFSKYKEKIKEIFEWNLYTISEKNETLYISHPEKSIRCIVMNESNTSETGTEVPNLNILCTDHVEADKQVQQSMKKDLLVQPDEQLYVEKIDGDFAKVAYAGGRRYIGKSEGSWKELLILGNDSEPCDMIKQLGIPNSITECTDI